MDEVKEVPVHFAKWTENGVKREVFEYVDDGDYERSAKRLLRTCGMTAIPPEASACESALLMFLKNRADAWEYLDIQISRPAEERLPVEESSTGDGGKVLATDGLTAEWIAYKMASLKKQKGKTTQAPIPMALLDQLMRADDFIRKQIMLQEQARAVLTTPPPITMKVEDWMAARNAQLPPPKKPHGL